MFMYMSWEKHPGNANAKLVYDTKPVVRLTGREKTRTENLIQDLLEEQNSDRFERKNMIEYKTLELHAYFCRYAFEQIGEEEQGAEKERKAWDIILKIVLAAVSYTHLSLVLSAERIMGQVRKRRKGTRKHNIFLTVFIRVIFLSSKYLI